MDITFAIDSNFWYIFETDPTNYEINGPMTYFLSLSTLFRVVPWF